VYIADTTCNFQCRNYFYGSIIIYSTISISPSERSPLPFSNYSNGNFFLFFIGAQVRSEWSRDDTRSTWNGATKKFPNRGENVTRGTTASDVESSGVGDSNEISTRRDGGSFTIVRDLAVAWATAEVFVHATASHVHQRVVRHLIPRRWSANDDVGDIKMISVRWNENVTS